MAQATRNTAAALLLLAGLLLGNGAKLTNEHTPAAAAQTQEVAR